MKNNWDWKTILMFMALAGLFFWSRQMISKNRAEAAAAISSSALSSGQVSSSVAPSSSAAVQAAVAGDSTKDSAVAALPQIARRTVVVKTAAAQYRFDNLGAKLTSVVLHGLKDSKAQDPELLQFPDSGALGLSIGQENFAQQMFAIEGNAADTITVAKGQKTTLSFKWIDPSGREVLRHFVVSGDSMNVAISVQTRGFDPIAPIELRWEAGLKETDVEKIHRGSVMGADYFFSEVVWSDGANVTKEQISESKTYNAEDGQAVWAGLRRKYVAALIDFGRPTEAKIHYDVLPSGEKNENVKKSYRMVVSDLLTAGSYQATLKILPLEYHQLVAANRGYEDILWSGYGWFFGANYWFPKLCGFLLWLLNIFYDWFGNYGIGIILLTLLVRTATLPLTLGQMRSTRLLQAHKPALDQIREKYSKDARKYQEELMKYYREAGINPLAPMLGCFPMLLQMPVFFGLFIVFGRSVELRDAPFFAWITDLSNPDIITTAISIPWIMPVGISLLPFIMAVTTYFQTKQTITDPNMKMMVWMMPTMMFVFSGLMPSGLVVYWIVSNTFSIAQYALMGKPAVVAADAPQIQGQKSFQKGKKK